MILVIGSDHDDYSEGFDPEWNLAGKNSTNSKFGSLQIQIKNIFLLSSVMGKVDNKRGTSVMSNRWKTTSMKVSMTGNVQIHVNTKSKKAVAPPISSPRVRKSREHDGSRIRKKLEIVGKRSQS